MSTGESDWNVPYGSGLSWTVAWAPELAIPPSRAGAGL